MPQINFYLDEREDDKIKQYSLKWKLSKVDTLKKIIIDFIEENKDGNY